MHVGQTEAFNSRHIFEMPTFKHWFGASKVIDGSGAPKKVYHGTRAIFENFEIRKRCPDLGFHFGSISQAEFFAGYGEDGRTSSGGNVRPAYLQIEKPLRMPDIFERGSRVIGSATDWLFKKGILDKTEYSRIYGARSAHLGRQPVITAIETAGYDGVVYENEHEGGTATSNEDSYIVFHSKQVRSVFEF